MFNINIDFINDYENEIENCDVIYNVNIYQLSDNRYLVEGEVEDLMLFVEEKTSLIFKDLELYDSKI